MDTLLIYQHIPDLVKTIIWEGEQLRRCIARNGTFFDETAFPGEELIHSPGDWQNDLKKGCIKKEGYEEGIPLWKSFSFHFWPTNPHPLGEEWTLAPYDYHEVSGMKNFFLGE
jgi:DNA mismatch repair protein MSH3